MAVLNNNALVGASGKKAGGYQISRSLRFNGSVDSTYLSRTPGSAGNRTTWTWSGWVKRSNLAPGDRAVLFGGYGGNNDTDWFEFGFNTNNTFYWTSYNLSAASTAVFRDPSAWYHIVVSYNNTNITVYVNNVTVLTSAKTGNLGVNGAWLHEIGRSPGALYGYRYFDGYLADIWFLDGIAATPSDFAETNATTGQWIPKAYTGSKGTNGFHLEFADNSNNTASTLGKDTSGNSNNWTPNNLSVTAGAGNDSLTDTPTSYGTGNSGGDVRGNFCVWNPLDSESGCTFANGNLEVSTNGGRVAVASFGVPTSGKWYWEGTFLGAGGTDGWIGAIPTTNRGDGSGRYYRTNGQQLSGGSWTAYGASYGQNDIIGVALDQDNNTVTFYKNGTSQGAQTSVPLRDRLAACNNDGSAGWAFNFGQRAFAYPVSGFKALVDTNLPAPVVAKPNTAFDVVTYTGNGSARSITLPGGFSPDLIWTKSRSAAYFHHLYDIVRGTNSDLCSNSTTNELTGSPYNDGVTAFNSSGYSLGTFNGLNENGTTYVAWAWDGGSSTVTNTQGSITSSVRANASAGFSIVSWTSTSSSATIGHGLGVEPHLIITKGRSGQDQWVTYHKSTGATQYLYLNATDAAATYSGFWNNTAPTSTVFTTGTDAIFTTNGRTKIAYCFAPVAGYSSFGSYTGNGSTDGPFVYTGMRPRFLIYKRTDAADTFGWIMIDSSRDSYNVATKYIGANTSAAEAVTNVVDFLSNGFKLRLPGADGNVSGGTYVYAAFAENPFQYARAR